MDVFFSDLLKAEAHTNSVPFRAQAWIGFFFTSRKLRHEQISISFSASGELKDVQFSRELMHEKRCLSLDSSHSLLSFCMLFSI